ncbi:MAG: alpha/beta hydrolase [Candidatus Eremiobacteraeota bacterium]|nr:alpha/beta hydrolase [Candidatus Eremiobacteraeota bacterium]
MNARGCLLSFLIAVLAGCGGNTSTPPSSPLLNLISAPIAGEQGGSLKLPNGDSVTFPAEALQGNQNVTLSSNAAETPSLPVKGWSPVAGTMTVAFSTAVQTQPRGTKPAPTVTLTFAYSKASASAILKAQAPVLEITTQTGSVQRISADATFNPSTNTATLTVLAEQLSGATSFKVYVAADGSSVQHFPLGPKLWNIANQQWQPEPFTIDPTKRTVVMVHGIFSAVESAFPCEQRILNAGNYGQAVGLDYDWTQPPATEAPFLANLINSLPLSTVDIEAHSYGTVVTLAALPLIKKPIGHVVLLGGPLPLNGAPQADPGFWRDLIMAGVWLAAPSEVEDAYKSGMINDMATNSAALQTIDHALQPLTLPPFVQAAGGSPLPQETHNTLVYLLYLYLYGGVTNDGIVEQKSATQSFSTKTSEITFLSDDHLQLECDPQVQQFVGPLVSH